MPTTKTRSRASAIVKSEIAQSIAPTTGVAETGDRFITKIRLSEMVTIEYVRPLPDGTLEHVSLKIPADEITADLEIKLNQHRDALIDAIGLDESLWNQCNITGADFKWIGESLQSYKLHGEAELEWSRPTVSATIPAEYSDLVKIEDLCAEVRLILDGKRSQLSLPLFSDGGSDGGAIDENSI